MKGDLEMARGKKTVVTETSVQEEVKTVPVETEKKDDVSEIELLKKQLALMEAKLEQAQAAAKTVPVIQMAVPETERVHFLFEAEVADDNVFSIGDNGMYGRITGKTGSFYIPKSDLSRVNDGLFRQLLDKRWIIAVSGLTDDEREALGLDYKEGEYLDKRAFAKMVDLGEEILDIYPNLCEGHREIVAKRYYEAYKAGNPNVTREIVTKLNALSKEAGSAKGDFTSIIEMMNESDVQ